VLGQALCAHVVLVLLSVAKDLWDVQLALWFWSGAMNGHKQRALGQAQQNDAALVIVLRLPPNPRAI
jgi:hypothetical protein